MFTIVTSPAVQLAVAALGAILLAWTARLGFLAATVERGPAFRVRRLLLMARALRAGLSGLCLAGLGLGWAYGSTGIVMASIVIGLEELYETSMALALLRRIEATERAAAGA